MIVVLGLFGLFVIGVVTLVVLVVRNWNQIVHKTKTAGSQIVEDADDLLNGRGLKE